MPSQYYCSFLVPQLHCFSFTEAFLDTQSIHHGLDQCSQPSQGSRRKASDHSFGGSTVSEEGANGDDKFISSIRLGLRASSAVNDNLQPRTSTTKTPSKMPRLLLFSTAPVHSRLDASVTSIPNQSSSVEDNLQSSSSTTKTPSKMPRMILFSTTPVHSRLDASGTSIPSHSPRVAADIASLDIPTEVISDSSLNPGPYVSSSWTSVNRPTLKQLQASQYFTQSPFAISLRKQPTTKYVKQQTGPATNIQYAEFHQGRA